MTSRAAIASNKIRILLILAMLASTGEAIADDLVAILPSACERTLPSIAEDEYAIDDGIWDAAVRSGAWQMVWLNQFNVIATLETITAVRIAWGFNVEGVPGVALIFDDPNNDGDPTDITTADLLASVPIVGGPASNTFVTYSIPKTSVGNAGDSFFVGACMGLPTEGAVPAALDYTDPDHARSWLAASQNGQLFDCSAPNSAQGGPLRRVDAIGPSFTGDWLVRASALGTVAIEKATWGMLKRHYE